MSWFHCEFGDEFAELDRIIAAMDAETRDIYGDIFEQRDPESIRGSEAKLQAAVTELVSKPMLQLISGGRDDTPGMKWLRRNVWINDINALRRKGRIS